MKKLYLLLITASLTLSVGAQKPLERLDSTGIFPEKIIYNYAPATALLNDQTEYYDATSGWEIWRKTIFTYDKNRNLSEKFCMTREPWDPSINDWKKNKWVYSYDSKGNLIKRIEFVEDPYTNQLIESIKLDFEYNAANVLIKKTESSGSEDYWEEYISMTYTVDHTGKYTSMNEIRTYGNVYSYKDTFIYSNGNNVETIRTIWDDNTNQWLNDSKTEYIYGSNNEISAFISIDWSNKAWLPRYKTEIAYDTGVSFEDIVFQEPRLESIKLIFKPISYDKYFYNGSWQSSETWWFYYSPYISASIDKKTPLKTAVYPNPAKDRINFDLSETAGTGEICVSDVNGKTAIRQSINAKNNTLDLTSLQKGIYFFRIESNEGVSTGKFLVE